MPMNVVLLKTAMKSRLIAEGFVLSDPASKAEKMIDIICEEVISHIQTLGTITIPSVTLVTPGVGVSGPGVGTIS